MTYSDGNEISLKCVGTSSHSNVDVQRENSFNKSSWIASVKFQFLNKCYDCNSVVLLTISVNVVTQTKYFIISIYDKELHLLSLQSSLWFWFLSLKFRAVNTDSRVYFHILKLAQQISVWKLIKIISWLYLVPPQSLTNLAYLHTTLWLAYHCAFCWGSLTPVERGFYLPTQQDFNKAE